MIFGQTFFPGVISFVLEKSFNNWKEAAIRGFSTLKDEKRSSDFLIRNFLIRNNQISLKFTEMKLTN